MESRAWKSVSIFSLICALSLLLLNVAFYASRVGSPASQSLFWISMLLLLAPIALRISRADISRGERVSILLVLGLSLYAVKVLYSPVLFTFLDELLHWRTTVDILNSHHLFSPNPLLAVSPYFPGLEVVTSALVSLTGISIYQAGILVIGVGRFLLILSLYLLYEMVSRSSRLAGVGTLLYMANPHFLLFDAQFAYESLSIPLAVLVLFAAIRYSEYQYEGKTGLRIVLVLGTAAVIVTHHVTAILLAAVFLAWAVLLALKKKSFLNRLVPTWIGIFSLIAMSLWFGLVARDSMTYLTSQIGYAATQFFHLLMGQGVPRQLFANPVGGQDISLILRVAAILAVLVILLALPYSLIKVWKKYRSNPLALILAAAAVAYPFTLLLRYTSWGLTIGSRTGPYIFLGIAFVLAVGFTSLYPVKQATQSEATQSARKGSLPFTVVALVVFLGMIASTLSAWGMPARYQVNTYTNSVDLEGEIAGQWAARILGPGKRFAAEPEMLSILGSYGDQSPVTPDADRIWVNVVYLSPRLTPENLNLLESGKVRYFAIDRRRGSQLLDPSTAGAASFFSQLDHVKQVSRLFDSGDIVIYDIGVLTHEK